MDWKATRVTTRITSLFIVISVFNSSVQESTAAETECALLPGGSTGNYKVNWKLAPTVRLWALVSWRSFLGVNCSWWLPSCIFLDKTSCIYFEIMRLWLSFTKENSKYIDSVWCERLSIILRVSAPIYILSTSRILRCKGTFLAADKMINLVQFVFHFNKITPNFT